MFCSVHFSICVWGQPAIHSRNRSPIATMAAFTAFPEAAPVSEYQLSCTWLKKKESSRKKEEEARKRETKSGEEKEDVSELGRTRRGRARRKVGGRREKEANEKEEEEMSRSVRMKIGPKRS